MHAMPQQLTRKTGTAEIAVYTKNHEETVKMSAQKRRRERLQPN
jgi:hypothetical protein